MTSAVQNNVVSSSLMNAMNPAKAAAGSAEGAGAAQDRFMTLLVTQMKNQDPLNPLDNAQVTSQLAQLSTVKGIDQTNATLASLISTVQSSQTLQATSMIGHGVLTAGKGIDLKDGTGMFGVQLDSAVDSLRVTVRDATGQAVHTMDLGPHDQGVFALQWDGKDDNGASVKPGHYTFDVNSTLSGKSASANPLTYGLVSSVANGSQGLSVTLPGLGERSMKDILQIM